MTTERAAAELRAWVAEEARRAREFDAGEHRREAFPQTATGRALSTSPLARSGRGPLAPGPLIVQREPSEGVTAGSGWQATLTADTTIPDGGGYFTFDTVETSHGVTVTVPTAEVVIPQDGVIAVQHLWAHWTGVDHDSAWKGHSSWVEIRVNGVQVAPRFEAGTSGLPYSRLGPLPGPKMAVKQGDLLAVYGHQGSGAGQAAKLRVSVGMEDPTQSQAHVPAELLANEGAKTPTGENFVDLPATTVGGTAVEVGDLLVAIVMTTVDDNTPVVGPDGWTEHVAITTPGGGAEGTVDVASRVADGTEAATYRWTHTSTLNQIAGVVFLFRGGAVAGVVSNAWNTSDLVLPVGPVGAGTIWLAGVTSGGTQSLARSTVIEPGGDFTAVDMVWYQLDDDDARDLTLSPAGTHKTAYGAIGIGSD